MTRRLVMLFGVAMCGCGPALAPDLTMSSDRGSFDGRMQRAIITMTATTSTGRPGTGSVTLVSGAGSFVEGSEVTLVGGIATATYRCDPTAEAACDGTVRLGATWSGVSSTVQVKVTPSAAVVDVKWRVVPTYTLETLTDVVVGPGHTYWAVGTNGTVIRYVNETWLHVDSGVTTTLRSAWSDGTSLVIVGDQDTFLIWDGTKLVAQLLDGGDDFTSLTGSTNALLATTTKGRVAHFNGTTVGFEWLGHDVLHAVAQSEGGDTWVLGETFWYHLQGDRQWANEAPPVLGNWLSARYGPDGLWVAGARDSQSGGITGVVLTGPTPDWRSSTVAPDLIRDIFFVDGSDERFAVTDNGVFRKPGASDWQTVDSPMGGIAVAGRSGTDLMVVGQGGTAIHRIQ